MKSSHPRRAQAALLLAIAALMSLATVPVLVGSASAGAATAHAAKASCRASGRAKARRCRRATRRRAASGGGKVPRPFTPLTGPDNLNVLVLQQRGRGGGTSFSVQVRRGNVEVTCTGGAAGASYTKQFVFIATARLRGASFASRTTFSQGNWVHVEGRFVNDRKATGTLQLGNVSLPDGAVCDSAAVRFTATR